MDVPWGHDVEESVFATVPTLVITGDWNDEYEAVAQQLALSGAAHVHLPGHRHRPQDHRDFESVLAEFVGARE